MNTTQTWIAGAVGQWFDAANWTSGMVPTGGDIVIIPSGMPEIDGQTIGGEQITLGGSSGGSTVTLLANSATFEPLVTPDRTVVEQTLTVTGGIPSDPVTATLLSSGTTSYEGQIFVEPVGGTLTVDAGTNGNFIFTNSLGGTFVLVSQESALHFQGAHITTAGVIEVEGSADITASVADFGGSGIVALDRSGQLSVEGAVSPGQHVYFADGTGKVTIANASAFQGTFGFTPYAGDRIDLTGVQAQSESVDPSTGVLSLYSRGNVVARLNVETINPVTFTPTHLPLQTNDFTIGSDGAGGTLITYTPQGPTYLEASMAVPVVATADTKVPLQSILAQSFGTTTPTPYGITLMLPKESKSTPTDQKFWVNPPAKGVNPAWYVNGSRITQDYTVRPGDTVELLVGDNIAFPAQIRLQVTPSATGTSAEFVTYDVWTVDPQVAALVQASSAQPGHPTTADIITSAQSWNTIFPNIPNTNLCDWIADDVGAAAGAAMPEPNQLYDPSLNVSGGFWRIVYTGSSLQNWSPLVQPGDVVRMQWFKQSSPLDISGHTTTVLGIGGPGGSITVYDNVNFVNGKETIGIHSATYWTATNPESITIYRLDPNQQYLIQGTSLGEVIQGSVYNNLIQPGGGADIITAGAGSNEIQDTTAHLNGIAVTDFHFGDEFDFTDLNPAQVTTAYTGTWLLVFNNNAQVATILLPGLPSNDSFVVTPDGNGGSLIAINSPGAVAVTAAGDFTSNGHPDFIWRNSNAVMSMWGYDPQAQTVSTISLGTVPFSWSVLGSAHFSNASTSQMLTDYVPNGTMTLWWVSSGALTGIDLGQNWPNIGFIANGQFTDNGGANISNFLVTNLVDHHLYDWWIGADNALHGIDLGLYWSNVALVAPGQFTANGGTNLLVNNTADNHLYDWWIGANGALQGIDLGPYWSNVAFVATGDFTASGNTNLLVNNTLDNHLYDWWIGNDNALHGVDLGAYWSNVQLVAAGRFDDNTANGEILVQNTVDHHLYEWWITAQGQLTGIDLGPYWANVQLIGHAHYNDNSTQEQLLVRNTSDGHFYQWWIANNQLTGVVLGVVAGSGASRMAAASPAPTNGSALTAAGASMMSPGIAASLPPTSTDSTSLLVQAMASFGSTEAVDNSPGALLGAAPSQLAGITAPVDQHLAHS